MTINQHITNLLVVAVLLIPCGALGQNGNFTHQSFGNSVEGGFTHQSFGNSVEGGFTHQTFGNDIGGGFTHQPFGNDAPLGGGLLILLSAGASYAALKRTRQNNKQQ